MESHRARAGDPSLFLRRWLPEQPRHAVVLVHGFAEHSGRYDELASWLAEHGCAVLCYDQRGHGRSGGPPGHVERFTHYLDDLELMVSELGDAHPELPISLLGHSMGGLVAAVFLAEREGSFARAVLSAPALAAGDDPWLRVLGGRLLRLLRPRHPLSTPVDPAGLSTDPDVVEAYLADPLVRHEKMTVSLALELMDGMQRALPDRIQVPTLVLHGGDDPICPPDASERFARELPRGEQVRYPGLRHEILNEPSRGEIYQAILRWLEAGEEPSR